MSVDQMEVMQRGRKMAKRDLIAQAAMVPKLMEESADRIRRHILALKNKEINEWEMVEAIQNEVFGQIHELGLTALTAKLVAYQLMDLEARRTMISTARELGVAS